MLFNCFKCGKSISSKKDVCVYCKTDVSEFTIEFNKERVPAVIKEKYGEKYAGTFFSLLLKTKIR